MHLTGTYETNYNYSKKEKFLIIEVIHLYFESMNRKLFKYAHNISALEITSYYYAPSLQGATIDINSLNGKTRTYSSIFNSEGPYLTIESLSLTLNFENYLDRLCNGNSLARSLSRIWSCSRSLCGPMITQYSILSQRNWLSGGRTYF